MQKKYRESTVLSKSTVEKYRENQASKHATFSSLKPEA